MPVRVNFIPLLIVMIVTGLWLGAAAIVCVLAGMGATVAGVFLDHWLHKVSNG